MTWLILTISAVTARSFMGISQKIFSNQVRVSPVTQSVLFMGVAAILAVLVAPFFGGFTLHGLSAVWPLVCLMVLTQAAGNILFYKGLSELEASIVAVTFSAILPWAVILSVLFLGSSFTLVQSTGIVLLFAAILIANYQKGIKRVEPEVLYIVAATLLFAVFQIVSAKISKTVPTSSFLLLNYAGTTAIIWLVYRKRVHRELRELGTGRLAALRAVIPSAMLSVTFFVLLYLAYKYAPDRGVVVLLQTSQVVLSVILAVIFLRERTHIGRKMSAGVLALVASILIKA